MILFSKQAVSDSLNRLVSSLTSTPGVNPVTPNYTGSRSKGNELLGIAAQPQSEELHLQSRQNEDRNEVEEDEEEGEDDEDEENEEDYPATRGSSVVRTGDEQIICNCKKSKCLKLYVNIHFTDFA